MNPDFAVDFVMRVPTTSNTAFALFFDFHVIHYIFSQKICSNACLYCIRGTRITKSTAKSGLNSIAQRLVNIILNGLKSGIALYTNPIAEKQFTLQMNNLAAGNYYIQLFIAEGKKNSKYD